MIGALAEVCLPITELQEEWAEEKMYNDTPHSHKVGLWGVLLRFLADSNRRKRFCRPVPSHSAKEPYAVALRCKVRKNLLYTQM